MKRQIRHIAKASAASLRTLAALALKKNNARVLPVDFHHERKSVFCIATRHQADQIVTHLKAAKFSGNDISVVSPDQGTTHGFARGKQTKAAEGAVVGAGTGGVVGAALGWIAGLGALAVLGCDPWVVGLSAGALGAVVLGVVGGRVGRGIPHVKGGDILIAVRTQHSGEIARAKAIFSTAGAQDGCQRGEASVEDRPPPAWSRRIRPGHFLAKCPRLLKPVMLEWTRRGRPDHSQPLLAAFLPSPA